MPGYEGTELYNFPRNNIYQVHFALRYQGCVGPYSNSQEQAAKIRRKKSTKSLTKTSGTSMVAESTLFPSLES